MATDRTDSQQGGTDSQQIGTAPQRILAPLRGVTVRAFRRAFAAQIRAAGFTGAVAPFVPANPGAHATARTFAELDPDGEPVPLVPQIISRHPDALRALLRDFRAHGFTRADLNAGCPFPMIVRRGRGAGLFRTPDVLERLLAVGCAEMGDGRFSLKIRLGLDRPDELAALLPRIARHPLATLTVHARTARQMYDGVPDVAAFDALAARSPLPVLYNGDAVLAPPADNDAPAPTPPAVAFPFSAPRACAGVMIGRAFVRALGGLPNAPDLLLRYIDLSRAELSGDAPVLGRMKELLTYWRDEPLWKRLWPSVKICRSVAELLAVLPRP